MTDYLTQVVHQLEQTRAELRRAEDELATHRQRACHETRLRAAWRSARRRARTADRQARDWRQANRFNVGIYDQAARLAQQAETERDGAYRERAQLLAWLAALHPAVLAPAPDVYEDGWQILYLTPASRQLSWHIHPRDADLFGHVEHVPADDPRAQWDGHTTAEKYQRIQALTAADQRQDTVL